jgi:hypothetical protein
MSQRMASPSLVSCSAHIHVHIHIHTHMHKGHLVHTSATHDPADSVIQPTSATLLHEDSADIPDLWDRESKIVRAEKSRRPNVPVLRENGRDLFIT